MKTICRRQQDISCNIGSKCLNTNFSIGWQCLLLQFTAHSGDARLWLGHIGPTIQDFGGWTTSWGEIILNLRPLEHPCHLPLIVPSSFSSSNKQNFLHFCSFAIRDGLSFFFAYFCFPQNNFLFPRNKLCISWRQVFKASKLLFWVMPVINIFVIYGGTPRK